MLTGAKDGWKRHPKKRRNDRAGDAPFISIAAVTFLAYHAPCALSMTVRIDSMTIVLSRSGLCVRVMTKGIRALRYTRDEQAGRPSLVRA